LLGPYAKRKYHIQIDKVADPNRQYLIIMNHQTAFDQFFVGLAFPGAVYYIASEDLFSNGMISRLLQWAVAPIPIKKQTTDIRAVKNCLRVAKEGGTIALAPEGNRTYNGRTVYIKPAIASLVRRLKLPLAVFRIEGGYGVQPRWSDVVRKGQMHAYVSEIIEPEQVSALSDEELADLINQKLAVDEGVVTHPFEHKRQAEFLERAMYVCPDCGLSVFESKDDVITCKTCGMQIRHLPTKELVGVNKEFPFRFVADWYDYQCDFVRKVDLSAYLDLPMYQDTVSAYQVFLYQKKKMLLKDVTLQLFGDRLVLGDKVFLFADLSALTVLGKNKLNLYIQDDVIQIKGDKRFNALKYVNMYYHSKSEEKEPNDEFLGL
jgi:1-acyl-sn-glycerol-3-phosphate acyltransferase